MKHHYETRVSLAPLELVLEAKWREHSPAFNLGNDADTRSRRAGRNTGLVTPNNVSVTPVPLHSKRWLKSIVEAREYGSLPSFRAIADTGRCPDADLRRPQASPLRYRRTESVQAPEPPRFQRSRRFMIPHAEVEITTLWDTLIKIWVN